MKKIRLWGPLVAALLLVATWSNFSTPAPEKPEPVAGQSRPINAEAVQLPATAEPSCSFPNHFTGHRLV